MYKVFISYLFLMVYNRVNNKQGAKMSKSRWEEYKAKSKPSMFDDINKKVLDSLDQDSAERLKVCNSCEHLIKLTKECKKNSLFVLETIKIKEQQCPIGAW
jgi:hypothetical protein